ncbi:MAG TPA: response regulator transcription factor [Bacteroidales bacterium]|nr:response regulator transcription factor [Bacteroidales bacterium]
MHLSTNIKANLLIAEDDENLSTVIKDYLTLEGYNITLCADGTTCWNTFKTGTFDICILDVMMPAMDGFTLAEQIRQHNENIPILFLTARSAQEDKIRGFRLGADDYILKPFNIEELVLRIEVFLKRNGKKADKASVYSMGSYKFDYSNLLLNMNGSSLKLTRREADILRFLLQNKNQLVKREDILLQLWGSDDYFLGRSLDVFISKLRKYLSSDDSIKIVNFHAVGFKLEIPDINR